MGFMTDADRLADLAALLADGTRAAFCLALLDGRAWTAGELARHAGVVASTATEHLNRLVAGGLLAEHRQGRHRYLRLAGPQVASLIEELTAVAGPPVPVNGLRAAKVNEAMSRGRTCYDHLAGRLGVAITDAMTAAGYLDQSSGFALTGAGSGWLTGTLGATPKRGRVLARSCVDWTERRPHLAGAAGAAICERLMDSGWVVRIGTSRAVRPTEDGLVKLKDVLDLTFEP